MRYDAAAPPCLNTSLPLAKLVDGPAQGVKPPVVNGRNRATQSGGAPLTATAHGSGGRKRDLALAQVALCSGARAVLKVLDHVIAEGESAEVQRTIERHVRRIRGFKGGDLLERGGTDFPRQKHKIPMWVIRTWVGKMAGIAIT